MESAERQRLHRFHALVLESVPDGICGIDGEGAITFVNPAGASMLRQRPDALVGRRLHDVVHLPTHRARECPLTEPMRAGGVRTGQDHFRRTTGELVPVEFMVSALAGAEIDGGVVSFRDATGRPRTADGPQHDRLLDWLAEAQQEERQRIAADIHDDTVQVMGAVGLRLELALARVDDPDQRLLLEDLHCTVREATDRLRSLLFQLVPPNLDEDLGGAIAMHGAHVAREGGFRHSLVDDLDRQPSRGRRETLFRMAHELLVNVRKHAAALSATTTIATSAGGYLLRVEDDGVGIAAGRLHESDPQHAGLRLIGDRVALAGGRWSIAARKGGGTMVEIWLPNEDLA